MAISKNDEHIEIRIKGPPKDSLCTYLQDYIDPSTADGPDNDVCESYIVAGEQDAQYMIEVILKPGFKLYGASHILLQVWFGGIPACKRWGFELSKSDRSSLKDEVIRHISSLRVSENEVEVTKKNLAFNRVETGS